MDFRLWLESLELQSTELPSIVNYFKWDQKNTQQTKAIHKNYLRKIWRFPIAKDSFIHFTLMDRVESILKTKRLGPQDDTGDGYNVFAISTSFGKWFPIVQFNHIISKKREKVISPLDLRTGKKEKMLQRGFRLADLGKEIGAIRFKTDKLPGNAHVEEVSWSGIVPLIDAISISTREAINILKHVPHKIRHEDQVIYY